MEMNTENDTKQKDDKDLKYNTLLLRENTIYNIRIHKAEAYRIIDEFTLQNTYLTRLKTKKIPSHNL